MAEGYVLSESDVKVLRWLVQRERGRKVNTTGRPDTTDPLWQPPEVYVARTPASGIAALVEAPGTGSGTGAVADTINFRECDIYRMIVNTTLGTEVLDRVPSLTKDVYNLSTEAVPGNAWVLAIRDKFGVWYAVPGSSDAALSDDIPPDTPGGGPCVLARLKTTDCLTATGPINSITMTGGGPWTGTGFQYLDVTNGTLVATWNTATGMLDLVLDGSILMNCGNGCYTGGPLTGHTRAGSDTSAACEGEVFTVCLSCVCCPIFLWGGEGWYCVYTGTGAGTGADQCSVLYLTDADKCDTTIDICSGPYATETEADAVCGLITTTCCPSDPLPGQLQVVVSGTAVLNGTYPLIYRGGGVWSLTQADSAFGTCPQAPGTEEYIRIECNAIGSTWDVYTENGASGPYNDGTPTCNPFEIVVTGVTFNICGEATAAATLTITAP